MFSQSIDGPVAVIGDVHGQTDLLKAVLSQLESRADYQDRWIVFIGDLVDRGRDSRGTLDVVSQLMRTHRKTTMVAGNHELAMAGALGLIAAPEYTDWKHRWLGAFGAEPTFASYGIPFGDCDALREALPAEHVAILAESPWCIEHPELFFVHAGLDPYLPLGAQKLMLQQRDFSLSTPGWLFSKSWPFDSLPSDCKQVVISGHVPVPEVRMDRQRILIDTTGGVAGDLSCVLMPERTVLTSGRGQKKPAAESFFSLGRLFGRRAAAF